MNTQSINKAQQLLTELTNIEESVLSLTKLAHLIDQTPGMHSVFTISVGLPPVPEKEASPLEQMGIPVAHIHAINDYNGDGWKNKNNTRLVKGCLEIVSSDTDIYQMLDCALTILQGRKTAVKLQLHEIGFKF